MQNIIIHPVMRIIMLLGLLVGLSLVALDEAGIKERISNIVFETYIKAKPREPSGDIVFVDIDDTSVSEIGQWPWPRKTIAKMITNIDRAGAKVIIFDGVLAEPDRTSPENVAALLQTDHPAKAALELMPANDAILAEAIKNTGKFVAGFSYGSNARPPIIKQNILAKREIKSFFLSDKDYSAGYFDTSAQFLRPLQKASAGNGSFMASSENDSVIRRTGVLFHNTRTLYPSLVLEGIRLYADKGANIKVDPTPDYTNYKIAEPFTVSIGRYKIPMSADSKMWVHFREFLQEETLPAHAFITGEELPDISEKIIFIASSAEGLMDLRSTPLGMSPGVYVHMNALEQILQNKYLIRPLTAEQLEVGAAVGIGLLIIALSFFVNPMWLAFIVLGVSGGAFWASWMLFDLYGGLFDPVTPTIIIVLTFIMASILSFLKTELERRQVRDAFGHYISPEFMKELTNDPDKLKLGGEIRELTVLFSDIRSFTSISEGLTPEELIQLMNDFLTPMSDLVMQNRGTIDKYMGDAMMAFWNAPLDDAKHHYHACITALGMQAALDPINEEIERKAKEAGKEPVLLKAGIGLNSGPCAVGNMGSKQRFAYSTLGDAVNLASRLEGQTKNYGVNILIGEQTYQNVPQLACLEVDLIKVKGKEKAERIFALLGDEKAASTEEYKFFADDHAQMIALYRGMDFKAALEKLKICRQQRVFDLNDVYDLYEERINDLLKNPPGDNWDGVFTATSK